MPQTPPYSKTVYDNLKQAYGDNFNRSYEEFEQKLSDPEYQKTVYANLKQAYGDDFKRSEAEFSDLLKKNESLQPSLQPSSEDSQTISKDKGRVSPLGEIKHAPNVANKPIMVGGQEPAKPKKEIPSIYGKIDIEQRPSSTATNVKPIQKPVAKPTQEGIEKTFKETKERFGVDMAMADYEEAQKDFADESKFIQRLESGDLELREKYFPEGLSQNFQVRRKQIKDLIADHKERLKTKEIASTTSLINLDKSTDSIIEDALKGDKYKDYLTRDVTGAIEVLDNDKIQELADKIVLDRGISDEGYVRRYLKNKLQTEVEFRSIEKDVNKEFLKQLEPLSDKDYNELVKRAATGDKEAQVQLSYQSKIREIQKGLPTAEQEMFKLELAAKNISKDMEVMIEAETAPINQSYKKVSDELNAFLKNQEDATNAKLGALTTAYQNGQISREQYEADFEAAKAEYSLAFDAKKEESMKAYDEYVKAINSVNSKYEKRYAREVNELQVAAEKRLTAANELLSERMGGGAIKDSMNNLYGVAVSKVSAEKERRNKDIQNTITDLIPIGRDIMFLKSTTAAFGGAMKGWGVSFGSQTMEDFGEQMEQRFKTYTPKTDKFSDLTDLNNLSVLSGNVIGGMIPSLTAAAVTTMATEGMGVGAAGQMVASAIASFGAETADIVGRTYADTFDRTGNVADAEKAAQMSMDSQIDLIWTYGLSGLPFVKNSLDFVPTQLGRIGVGALAEYGEEFIQEFNQNIAQENIDKGLSPWDNYLEKISDTQKLKETAISIAPVALIGGVGQVGSKSKVDILSDTFVAAKTKNALNDVFEDQKQQYFRDLTFTEGVKTTKAVIASLYTGGQISEAEMAELNSVVDEAQSFEATAKENGLSFNDRDIYAFYASRANAAERRAAETDDEIMSKLYQQQAKDYRNAAVDFLSGKESDFFSIKYKDGSQFLFSPQDAREAFKSDKLKDALENNEVEIAAFSEEGAKSLNALMADVKARKENKEAAKQEVANAEMAKQAEPEVKAEVVELEPTVKEEVKVEPVVEEKVEPTLTEDKVEENVVVEPKVGDTVPLPPRIKGGQERTMIFTEEGWKQKVGDQVTEVNEATRNQAQEAFTLTASPTAEKVKGEVVETVVPAKIESKESPINLEKNRTNEALKDVESTAKALEGVDIENKLLNKTEVVDKQNNPLKLYHGTNADFDDFVVTKSSRTIFMSPHSVETNAFFFHPNVDFAKSFGSKIKEVKLNVKKLANNHRDDLIKAIKETWGDLGSVETANNGNIYFEDYEGDSWLSKMADNDGIDWMLLENSKFIKNLEKRGIDGTGVWEDDNSISFAVFDAKNIIQQNTPQATSQAYHAAKADGSNPELVKAVEELLGGKTVETTTETTKQTKVEEAPKVLEGKEAAKAKVDAVAEKIKAALKVKGIEGVDVKRQGLSAEDNADLVAANVKKMIDAGWAVKDAVEYVIDAIKNDVNENEIDSVRDRATLKANENLIEEAREAGKAQKTVKGKKDLMEKALASKGQDAKKAIFVEINFDEIATKLIDNKIVKRKCD